MLAINVSARGLYDRASGFDFPADPCHDNAIFTILYIVDPIPGSARRKKAIGSPRLVLSFDGFPVTSSALWR
jgi:hypothetical protein